MKDIVVDGFEHECFDPTSTPLPTRPPDLLHTLFVKYLIYVSLPAAENLYSYNPCETKEAYCPLTFSVFGRGDLEWKRKREGAEGEGESGEGREERERHHHLSIYFFNGTCRKTHAKKR